ncbi:HAD family hydrolase [Wenyingzhuangia sp. IMCC45533]
MKKLPYPKAVLFDFDGVVVNSVKTHGAAWSTSFRQIFDKEICPFPHATHAGKAPAVIAEYYATFGGDKSKGSELEKLKEEHLKQTVVTTPPDLLPGAFDLEAYLTEKDIPHGIASNAPTSFVKNSVKETGIGFTVCMGVDQFSEPKPSPIPYLTLAATLGIKEEDFPETIIFEDSLTGIKAAAQTGMVAVGMLTQYTEEELLANGAVKVFPTLLEAYQEIVSL